MRITKKDSIHMLRFSIDNVESGAWFIAYKEEGRDMRFSVYTEDMTDGDPGYMFETFNEVGAFFGGVMIGKKEE